MITVYENAAEEQPQIFKELNDIRQLLSSDEFITLQEMDAQKACQVLGTSRTYYKPVYWRRNDNDSLYTDYVVVVD